MKFILNEILTKNNMTQAELARQTLLSRNAINALANHPKQIRLDTLETVCRVLNVTPNELFRFNGSSAPETPAS